MKYLGITKRSDVRTALLVAAVVLFAVAGAGAAADPGPVPAWIIVDDGDPGFSAPGWSQGYSSAAYGGDFHWKATGSTNYPATWTYTVPAAGSYRIYTCWVQGTNRTPQAAYTVYHSSGWTTVYVNQQMNGSSWNALGTFNLAAGSAQVKLSSWGPSGYVVIADAVAAARVLAD